LKQPIQYEEKEKRKKRYDLTEPEHIIDETATIRGADIEKVYNDCVNWLNKIQATIKEQDNPFFLHATHIELFGGQFTRVIKWIDIRLSEGHESVIVNIIIDPPKGLTLTRRQRRLEQYRLSWNAYVKDLWKSVGVLDPYIERQLYPYEVLENQVSKMKRNMFVVAGITLIFIFMVFSGISPDVSNILSGAILLNLYLVFRLYLSMSKIKNRILELYPDR